MPEYSKAFPSCDAAALGGFKKILKTATQEWKRYEYGFLIVATTNPEERFYYTEPYTDKDPEHISWKLLAQYRPILRACCHTHPKPSNFSPGDFDNFKQLRQMTKIKGDLKLAYDVAYYLMSSDGQIRRANREDAFFKNTIIEGIDKAEP